MLLTPSQGVKDIAASIIIMHGCQLAACLLVRGCDDEMMILKNVLWAGCSSTISVAVFIF
jgi:hypothetical protein